MFQHKTRIISTLTTLLVGLTLTTTQAQDTLQHRTLGGVSVTGQRYGNIERLPAKQGTYLLSGKKTEVIQLDHTDANVSEKTARQLFAKVPGVFVYDMDGSGNQINISTRGLDPHRGWEFNVRANGVMTNSDIYGYPASHFSPPMEAIGRIELVRGTGALQYGAQFGGMLNYAFKQPDTTRRFNFESINAVGSFGMVSTYNSLGGKLGKLQYFVYHSNRTSDGYRQNSQSKYNGQGLILKYAVGQRLDLRAELQRSYYVFQLPGQMTDAQFAADPRQSTRSRNFYSPEIVVPSVALDWRPTANTRLSWQTSAVLGDRSSVMWDRTANIRDTINRNLLAYNPRQVDIDNFNSYTSEVRLTQDYSLLGHTSTLLVGAQYINNDLHRRQLGVSTAQTGYDLSVTEAGFGRDLHLKSQNVALFFENKFQLTPHLSVSPGLRYESGASKFSGKTAYYDPADLLNTIEHKFPLLGINGEYARGAHTLYGGFSQAYRPVILKDIIPANIYEQVNKDLKDAYGYNAEIGWRGTAGGLKWDVTAFEVLYKNRLGTLAQYDADIDTFVLYRTNIGDARTRGVELFVEYGCYLGDAVYASVFTSTSYFHARYLGDSLRVNSRENRSIEGKKVEGVPEWISRNGVNVRYKKLSVSLLYSYTAKSYADPLNTEAPSANGAVGLVPAYGLLDFNSSWRISPRLSLRFNVSNLLNQQYFTKRPTFYPGPGIWPSDGRGVNLSVGVRL